MTAQQRIKMQLPKKLRKSRIKKDIFTGVLFLNWFMILFLKAHNILMRLYIIILLSLKLVSSQFETET